MKELYYINNDKNGLTWIELLQWCYKQISNEKAYGHWNTPNYRNANEFFSNFRHNINDGGYWTNGKYERIFIGYDIEKRENLYINGKWIPPYFKYKNEGYTVTDSYGRIIPSGYIRDCYLKFKPCLTLKKKESWGAKRYGYYNFRRGPVPGIHSYKKGWWHKTSHTNHSLLGYECRSTLCFKSELSAIREEFNVNVKYNKGRASLVEYIYTDWDGYHSRSVRRSWKRTKVKKQWMRGLRNKSS